MNYQMHLPAREKTEVFATVDPGFVAIKQFQQNDDPSIYIHHSDIPKVIEMLKQAAIEAEEIEQEESEKQDEPSAEE